MNEEGWVGWSELFSKGACPELNGRSVPYLSWSENNHLCVSNVLMFHFGVLYFT